MDVRAALMLGAYNAVSEAAWLGLRTLARARLVGNSWRLDHRTGHYGIVEGPAEQEEHRGPRIWMHAASVGEVRAAAALAESLYKRMGGGRILLSVLTTAGLESAREKIPDIATIVQAPIDLKGPVKRAISWFDPSLLLLVETEIWPNMILESARRQTSVAVVSGRISRRSYGRYRLVRPLMRHLLSSVSCVCAQTEDDARRFRALGMAAERVWVTGDVKLDAELPEKQPAAPDWLPEIMGKGHRWLFCAGSTRPGEEEVLGRGILLAARNLGEGLTAVVAPRHVHRAHSVVTILRGLGFSVAMRSTLGSDEWTGGQGPRALVLDTMGELAGVYTKCDVAFVGGTLAPYGGHNLAEPAAVGVPVLFGPHVDKTERIAESLTKSGGGLVVSAAEDLGASLAKLLLDSRERRERGAAAKRAVRSLQGATERTIQCLREAGALRLPPAARTDVAE